MTPFAFRPILLATALTFTLLFTGVPAIAQKKAARNGAEQIAQTSALRSAFLQKSRDALAEGNRYLAATLLFAKLKVFADDRDEKMKDLGMVARNAKPTIGDVPPVYLKFVKDTKEAMLPEAKAFIQSFTKTDERGRATDMVAQWITALDAIGNRNSEAEASKFETLANRMTLEM